MFVSWRLLGTDDEANTTFDILRDDQTIVSNYRQATSYQDPNGTPASSYRIATRVKGEIVDVTPPTTPWSEPVKRLRLNPPADGKDCTYTPNDCSVGDVDGDGEYELFVKWNPSNARDNSHNGETGNVYIDCYRFTGEQLWRIDLGPNIRAGAHYTQFIVYDFDTDGRAELICKTAPSTVDATGTYVNQAATLTAIQAADNTHVHRNANGHIDSGQEYLTVFEGLSGRAVHTIFYNPNRDTTYGGAARGMFNWDERRGHVDDGSKGNRGERYLACAAYLDGPDHRPSCIFSRGYYTYAFVWAVDYDGHHLRPRWLHASTSNTSYTLTDANGCVRTYKPGKCKSGEGRHTMYGNGNHNLSVADVDADGCDEIIWGSAALDHDGTLLYAVGFGHGDAIHLADLNPDRPGLELFQVHENKGRYTWDIHDAATGEILLKGGNERMDNGRGMAAQLDPLHRGYYISSIDERSQRSAVTGQIISPVSTSLNFRIYWDGDLQDELLNGTVIEKWSDSGITRLLVNGRTLSDWYHSSSCNGTKRTPNLTADLFGDWREEIILWDASDSRTLNIFTTNEPTSYRIPTLMHDHTYRMGIVWQNVGYNQPPHLGYYLPDRFR